MHIAAPTARSGFRRMTPGTLRRRPGGASTSSRRLDVRVARDPRHQLTRIRGSIDGLDDVDEQVADHVDDRDEQRDAQDRRRVERPDRVRGVAAEPRPVEDRLDEERVHERVREHEREQRDDRAPRVPEGEAPEHAPLGEAERPHHPHVVLADRVQDRGAHHPGDDAGGVRRDHDRREDHVIERAAEHGPVAGQQRVDDRHVRDAVERARVVEVRVVRAGDRQEVQPLEEHELEHDRQPERRHRDPDDRDQPRADVRDLPFPPGGHEAERDPDGEREQHRDRDELDRGRGAPPDVVEHRPAGSERDAPVAGRDPADVLGDLDGDRAVEPELLPRLLDLLGARPRARPRRRRIARHDARDDEREHDDAQDDQRGERQPPDDEPRHAAGVSS